MNNMRPLDRFFLLADREKDCSPEGRLGREFVTLTAPLLGEACAEALCFRTASRLGDKAGLALGNMAAFLLGEFDDRTMDLDDAGWDEIRETLEDAASRIDLNILTGLMGELLSRGKLNREDPA
jgi:hypothetical protein